MQASRVFLGRIRLPKKLVSFGVLLLLMFSPTFAYSQLVGSSAVKGNFGIEGDVYANWLQFPNIAVPPVDITTPAAGTDDWFVDALYTGSGRGVIDQSMPYPIIDNTAFERRQSITTPTAPFPYPVVPAVGPPLDRQLFVVGCRLWKGYLC